MLRPELDVGQRARLRVRLRPRARHVDPPALGEHLRRAEPLVALDHLPERLGDRQRVALDHHVEVAHGRAEPGVADRAADQPQR